MIHPDREISEAKFDQRLGDRAADLRLDHGRGRTQRIHVALIELAEASARRTIGAPHRLNLIPLEQLRQLVMVMGNHPRERDGQIVPQREIRLSRCFVLAALEDLEDELIALFPVLPHERVDVLGSGGLERLKAIALVDTLDDANDVFAATHVFREEVAHPARGFSTSHVWMRKLSGRDGTADSPENYSRGSVKPNCFWYLPFL